MNISLKFFKLSLALVIASSFLSCDVEDNESYPLPALTTITEFAICVRKYKFCIS